MNKNRSHTAAKTDPDIFPHEAFDSACLEEKARILLRILKQQSGYFHSLNSKDLILTAFLQDTLDHIQAHKPAAKETHYSAEAPVNYYHWMFNSHHS